jgi:hypothetical protein
VCTLGGLPVLFALTGAKAEERETLRGMLDMAPEVEASHRGQTIIGDKNCYGREFERDLAQRHLDLLRPARKGEPERAGAHLFKPLRQVIESINQTFKGQLDLERYGGERPPDHTAQAATDLDLIVTYAPLSCPHPAGGKTASHREAGQAHAADWRPVCHRRDRSLA